MKRQRQRGSGFIRMIDFVFYNERKIREKVEEARTSLRVPELKNGSKLSDPTASQAIYNLTPLAAVRVDGHDLPQPEKWLEVVDKVYEWCKRQGDKFAAIVRGRYAGKYFGKLCVEYEVSVDKFYEIIERARQYASLQAAYLHLISID